MLARAFPWTCPGSCQTSPSTHQSRQMQCHTEFPGARDSCRYFYTITPTSASLVKFPFRAKRAHVFLVLSPEDCINAALFARRHQQQFPGNRDMPLAVKDHECRCDEQISAHHSWELLISSHTAVVEVGRSMQELAASIPVPRRHSHEKQTRLCLVGGFHPDGL